MIRHGQSRLCVTVVGIAVLMSSCVNTPQPTPTRVGPINGASQNRGPLQDISATQGANSSQVLRLKNGLNMFAQILPKDRSLQVQIGFLAGSLFVKPGVAEIAARVLVESSDSTTSRPSLKNRIKSIGGTVTIQLGLTTTWIDIRVDNNRRKKAMLFLREALDSVTQSRSQIERMRGELVTERALEVQADPINAVTRSLLLAERGTDAYLDGLLDVDPSEVTLFQSRLYRPERALLAIGGPMNLDQISKLANEPEDGAIAGWLPPAPTPGDSPLIPREFVDGLYWAQGPAKPGLVQVAMVLRLPDASVPNAAEWLIMHSCLTLDGVGGRLEKLQDLAGLPPRRWKSNIQQTGDSQALVISTFAPASEIPQLWQTYQRARQSLVDVPPTPSEISLALRRAQLNATHAEINEASRLRIAAKLGTRNQQPGILQARLLELSDPSTWNPKLGATEFLATPAWMIAIGDGRPDAIPGMVPFNLLPTGFELDAQMSSESDIASLADPWLAKARAATGSAQTYARVTGFQAQGTLVADLTPEASDKLTWAMNGELTRDRVILGENIITKLSEAGWTESMNKVRKSIDAREAMLLRHEMMRNPIMLIAANAQGTLKFRPIAQRTNGDREFMILESVGTEFDRLRIHIDIESHLIRVVESWERLADDTLVFVREKWADYRQAGPMRVPHRRRTSWNNGEHQTETVFTDWLPTLSIR